MNEHIAPGHQGVMETRGQLIRHLEVRHTKKSRQLADYNARKLNSKRLLNQYSPLTKLPKEIIVFILSYLPAKDLLKAREISLLFKKIIFETRVLWVKLNLNGLQPMVHNGVTRFFERLASYGNAEASVKLAINSLYFFNLKDVVKTKVAALECAKLSCIHFLSAENALPNSYYPFTWIFTRPPWVLKSGGLSNKELIFRGLVQLLVKYSKQDLELEDRLLLTSFFENLGEPKTEFANREIEGWLTKISGKLAFNIAKLLMLCDDFELRDLGVKIMQLSSKLGDLNAAYEVLCLTEESSKKDGGCQLQWTRQLKHCALAGNVFAKFRLCLEFADGRFGDTLEFEAQNYVKELLQTSRMSHIHNMRSYQKELEDLMRVILVDWLIEITDTKDMPQETIFMAVDLLDRYLMSRTVRRVNLQLAGTTALLISTRFCCERNQLLTIRESSWLTDSTYGYREVVYMMAEYTGALKGQFLLPNLYHTAKIISTLCKYDRVDDTMLLYLLESSLKFTDFGRYRNAVIACSAALLINICQGYDAWSSKMSKCTGYEVIDLANCAMLLAANCLGKVKLLDDREQLVEAADQKYSRDQYFQVAKYKFPSPEEFKLRILSLDERLVPVQRDDHCEFEISTIDISSSPHSNSLDYEADCEDCGGEADSSFEELSLFHPVNDIDDEGDCSDIDLNEEVGDIFDLDSRHGFIDREGATPSFYSDNENKMRLLPHRVHHSTHFPKLRVKDKGITVQNRKRRKRYSRRMLSSRLARNSSSEDDARSDILFTASDSQGEKSISRTWCRPGLKRPAPKEAPFLGAKRKKMAI